MPLARARCQACSEPLGDPPHVPVACRCGACGREARVPFGADGQPASFETMLAPPALLRWFVAARHAMVHGRPGVAIGRCACGAPLVLSSRAPVALPCPHCRAPVDGEAAAVLVDQWPEPWCKVEGGGLSLEYRLAVVDDTTGVTAGCAACGLATPANEPEMRCRRCNAVTWVPRAGGRRVQLGVRIDGTRAGQPFKALVPIAQGEQRLRVDAMLGASSESSQSMLGITGVGCAIAAALVLIPIALAIAYAIAK